MTQRAAQTASGPTVTVAVEQYFPKNQRIIHDDLASQILPFSMRAFVQSMGSAFARDWMVRATEKALPGIWSGLMCRKRYIDEKVNESVDHGQVNAVVNLGAGFDTRAYRLPALADVPVWEIDQPVNIKPKQARLQKIFGAVPAHVKLVPIDFDHENLGTVLAAHGYAIDEPTFFIWEAVTQYLTETGIKTTFDFLAKTAPGSRLAFTYVCKDFLDGQVMYEGHERVYRQYVIKDQIWLFGLDPENVANFLSVYGWRVLEHLSYAELAERYVPSTGRNLATTPIERMVYAEKG